MKLGSLCTGIGGLDLAVEAHYGAELAWCAEIDPAASAVLAHRFPDAPNLGDFRDADPDPVDVLCAGFPCQPVSTAGRRAGTDDDRWLFDDIVALVGRMEPRPRVLVFENVAGLLSANDGDAMARVVHGLARLGYVGSWGTVRASDVGAPHRRARVFIVATADAERRAAQLRREPRLMARAPGPVEGEARQRERERGGDVARDSGAALADASHLRCDRVAWGPYAAAVARWEHALGRPAPAPVDHAGRLNPALVEWMMGYPEGWVTDLTDRRTDALRMLGNAVVPQQAALALELLA
jgi:DNA (cytosine-5)-methyltransferase 1